MVITEIKNIPVIEVVEFVPQNKVKGVTIKLANAIKKVETGGKYNAKGASGEYGAYQFLPTTFNSLSKQHLGEVVQMTPANQSKIALITIDDLITQGYTVKEVATWWNSGNRERCGKGINKHGVKYDCPAYVDKVLAVFKTM